jgi:hypothetical protein
MKTLTAVFLIVADSVLRIMPMSSVTLPIHAATTVYRIVGKWTDAATQVQDVTMDAPDSVVIEIRPVPAEFILEIPE